MKLKIYINGYGTLLSRSISQENVIPELKKLQSDGFLDMDMTGKLTFYPYHMIQQVEVLSE